VSVPVLEVIDWGGHAVAENGVLTIAPVHLRIDGVARTVPFTVHIELSEELGPQPFRFLNNGDDACHRPSGTTSGLVLDCQYPLPVDDHGDVTLAPRLTITPITASLGSTIGGSVKLSITPDGGGTAVGIRPIDLHRHVHLTASAPDSVSGHVGDIVDVPWTVTSTGPDELPSAGALFTFTAPPGTEWTGRAAAQCDPPVVPKTKYVCTNATVLLPGSSFGDTWQLKIISDVVGTGHITAQLASNAGLPPDQAITDPAEGRGSDAEINVKVLPGPPVSDTPTPATSSPATRPTPATSGPATSGPATSSPATEPLKPAQPAPSTRVAALPTTGGNSALIATVGLLTLIAGGILLAATRRRRKISHTG
jgi:LPXTG-motif cell wall-anchored protein